VQGYLALISQGKILEAYDLIRKSIPFPSVCGRVCFSPCEDSCTRGKIDEPVSIRSLKRFVADYAVRSIKEKTVKPAPRLYDEKIAVIGAGPAGLTAAYELARMGYPVTVFEKDPEPGGMMRYGIPPYRLPKDVLDSEIEYIKESGVEIRCNTEIGKNLTFKDLSEQGYKAIFIATGAHKCRRLRIEGEDLKGVLEALTLLRRVNLGEKVDLRGSVAVIGGGNVAIDAARTALRLGAEEVTVVYRRSRREMPAHPTECEEARKEGVKFQFLASPKRILGEDGRVVALECIRMRLGKPDETGRRRPIPMEGSEFQIPVSTVIISIGEEPDISFLPGELCEGRRVSADLVTLETRLQGFFAGGDAVRGPSSVIEAIADGKRAAQSIHRFLRGGDIRADIEESVEGTWVRLDEILENIDKKPRIQAPLLPVEERVKGFDEVELKYSEDEAISEAHRCLFCGPCFECLEAEGYCEPGDAAVNEARCILCANCEAACVYGAIRAVKPAAKVDLDLCKGCGECLVECPGMAISLDDVGDDGLLQEIKEAVTAWPDNGETRLLVLLCKWSGYAAIENLKGDGEEIRSLHPVRVACSGSIDPLHIVRAFLWGVDGILIGMCGERDCHYVDGNVKAEKRIEYAKNLLSAAGIDPTRVRVERVKVNRGEKLLEAVENFREYLEKLGPNPYKERT
jgi:NADPH-dependent glutamate synthase beta subunit-like oxidoreductase/coenzyme F420-reducing hydrogenase delta subunit